MFRFLISNAGLQQKIDEAASTVLERQRVVERLETVLTNLQPTDSKGVAFYTALFPDDTIAPSLIVSFNAGIDPNPEYSHVVTGRIYVTEKGELMLGVWPQDKTSYRTEMLLQNVHALEWQFLGKKKDKDPKTPLLGNSLAWLKAWPETSSSMPDIIRLKLWFDKDTKKDPHLQFAFIRPVLTPIPLVK